MANWSKGRALGLKLVGAEYLSRNSLIPFLAFSQENSASLSSFPGAKKMTVAFSERPYF